jgi:hypothetical protein
MSTERDKNLKVSRELVARCVGGEHLEDAALLFRDLEDDEVKQILEAFVCRFFPNSTIVHRKIDTLSKCMCVSCSLPQ